MLVAGIIGVATTEGAKQLSHSISFGVTLAMLTNLTQFVWWNNKKRTGSHLSRFGPTYLCLLSVPLVMADLTRHVLQDAGMVKLAMYRNNCDSAGIKCLSVVGWLFTIVFTYLGFACLLVGVFWSANLVTKLRKLWQNLKLQLEARKRRQADAV